MEELTQNVIIIKFTNKEVLVAFFMSYDDSFINVAFPYEIVYEDGINESGNVIKTPCLYKYLPFTDDRIFQIPIETTIITKNVNNLMGKVYIETVSKMEGNEFNDFLNEFMEMDLNIQSKEKIDSIKDEIEENNQFFENLTKTIH